jgi:hypothetical protein
MALSRSALSELLDAIRAGGGDDTVRCEQSLATAWKDQFVARTSIATPAGR